MDYKQKYLKYKQKYLNLKNQIGGEKKEVPLTSINIQYAMLRMANKIKDLTGKIPPVELNPELYSKYKKVHVMGVGELDDTRMRRIMELSNDDFNALLLREPIDLKYDYTTDEGVHVYDILNGRHRITRAIFYNLPTIYANVSGEPVVAPKSAEAP